MNAAFSSSMTSMRGTPTRIASPPGRIMLMRLLDGRLEADDLERHVGAAAVGELHDRDDRVAVVGVDASVAPNCLAISSLESKHVDGDDLAPRRRSRAPWITLRPTPPQPIDRDRVALAGCRRC